MTDWQVNPLQNPALEVQISQNPPDAPGKKQGASYRLPLKSIVLDLFSDEPLSEWWHAPQIICLIQISAYNLLTPHQYCMRERLKSARVFGLCQNLTEENTFMHQCGNTLYKVELLLWFLTGQAVLVKLEATHFKILTGYK